jgi:hypothetical protein
MNYREILNVKLSCNRDDGVAVESLEHRVTWYQEGPIDLVLYIPYTLKIAPLTH